MGATVSVLGNRAQAALLAGRSEVDNDEFFGVEYTIGTARFRQVKIDKRAAHPDFVEPAAGSLVQTTRGPLLAASLQRVVGTSDEDNSFTWWVEYRDPASGEVLHRSARVAVKRLPGDLTTKLG